MQLLSEPDIPPVPPQVLTGIEWHMSCYAPARTRRDTSHVAVAYAFGLVAFKTIVRIPNSQTRTVCFSVSTLLRGLLFVSCVIPVCWWIAIKVKHLSAFPSLKLKFMLPYNIFWKNTSKVCEVWVSDHSEYEDGFLLGCGDRWFGSGYQHFSETCCFHLQARRVPWKWSQYYGPDYTEPHPGML
jgi:hypothetical protein